MIIGGVQKCQNCGELVLDMPPQKYVANERLCDRCHIILVQFGLNPEKIEHRDMGTHGKSQIVVPRLVAGPIK